MGHPRPFLLVLFSVICQVALTAPLFKDSYWKLQDHFYINQEKYVCYHVKDDGLEFRHHGNLITVYADVASDGIPVLHYINESGRGLFIISSKKHLYGDLKEHEIRLTTGRIVVILYDATKLSVEKESSLRLQLFSFMKNRKMLKNKTYNLGPLRSSLSEILKIPAVVGIYESHKRRIDETSLQQSVADNVVNTSDSIGPEASSTPTSGIENQSVTLIENTSQPPTSTTQSCALKQLEDHVIVFSDSSGHEVKFTQELVFGRQIILRIDNPLQRGLLVATGVTSFYYRSPNMRFPLSLETVVAFVYDSTTMDEIQEEDLRSRATQYIRSFYAMNEEIGQLYDLQQVLIDLLKSTSTLGSVVVFEKHSGMQFAPPLILNHHSPPEIVASDLQGDDGTNVGVESEVNAENYNIIIRDEDGNIFKFFQRIGPGNDVVLLAINDSRRGLLIISRSSQAKLGSRAVRRSLNEESVLAVVYGTSGLSDEQEKVLRAELVELIRALNQFDDLDPDWGHTAEDAIQLCASNNVYSVSIAIFERNLTSKPKPPIVYQMASLPEPSREYSHEDQLERPGEFISTVTEADSSCAPESTANPPEDTTIELIQTTHMNSNPVESSHDDLLFVEDEWVFNNE